MNSDDSDFSPAKSAGEPDYEAIQQYFTFSSHDLVTLFHRVAQFCENHAEDIKKGEREWGTAPLVKELIFSTARGEDGEPPEYTITIFGQWEHATLADVCEALKATSASSTCAR